MPNTATPETSHQSRSQMINQQCRTWGVQSDAVLTTLLQLDRAAFVPSAYDALAYADWRIPLNHNQTMLSPKLEGRFLEALNIKPFEHVLLVGVGSGYLCACIAHLASQVTALELYPDLVEHTQTALTHHQFDNVTLHQQDFLTYEDSEQYDVIVFTSALPEAKPQWFRSLKVGGRALAVIGKTPPQQATLIHKHRAEQLIGTGLFETQLPYLIGVEVKPAFEF